MKKFKRNTNLTQGYLQRAAYRYLERYATTEANLIFILTRKAERILAEQEDRDEKLNEAVHWIKEIVEKCVKHGLVDDKLYAEARVNAFLNAGNSLPIMRNKLRAKGVPADIINQVIEALMSSTPNVNLKSCVKYAKKRRFGPYRIRNAKENTDKKEQASMARAGFSYDETMRVLKASRDELDDILYENP